MWDVGDVHGHGSARAERVRSGVFWGESKSGRSHLLSLGPDDGDDVRCADGVEAVIRGEIANGGGEISSPGVQAEEDFGACLDWAGYGGLGPEVGDGPAAGGILLIIEGDEYFCSVSEMVVRGVPREEKFPNKEYEVHEGPYLDRPAVAGALHVFAGLEAEVEANCVQVGKVVGYGVGGSGCCGNNGANDS